MIDGKLIVWPDRIGLAFSILMLTGSLLLVIVGHEPLPQEPYPQWVPHLATEMTNDAWIVLAWQLYFVLPIWLFARLIDFVLGGPKHRYEARLDQEFRENQEFLIRQKYGWEEVNHHVFEEGHSFTDRMAVPEGWIYKHEGARNDALACSIVFVPSKPHKRF